MSPNGMQFASVAGLHAVLKPAVLNPDAFRYCRTAGANVVTQTPPPPAIKASAIEALKPLGRKKFISAADTHGFPLLGFTLQGRAPLPTANGPNAELEFGSPCAASQLATNRSPRCALELM